MNRIELDELQNIQTKILFEVVQIMNRHKIDYSLEGGSLIGAIKYNGFVPWDDDIDIILTRENYNKFCFFAHKELNKDYFIENYNVNPGFPLNYTKVFYKKSIIKDFNYSKISTISHCIFIDIFPIDRINEKKLRYSIRKIGLLTGAKKFKLKLPTPVGFFKKILYCIVSFLPFKIINKLITHECAKYNNKHSFPYYEICNPNLKFKPLESNVFDNYTECDFNGISCMIVENYDYYLKSRFGENYMNELPPIDLRKPSHGGSIFLLEEEQ